MDPGESSAAIVRPTHGKTVKYIKWALLLAGAVWFARYAYLRITLRPTPRPEYWAAQIAELDPPGPDALTAREAEKIFTDDSWHPSSVSNRNRSFQSWEAMDLLAGEWDPARPVVQEFDKAFRSDKFIARRSDVRRAAQVGWHSGFLPVPNSFHLTTYAARQWGSVLIAHSRWIRETYGDMRTVVEDWETTLMLGRRLAQPDLVGYFFDGALERLVAQEILLTAREIHKPIDVRDLAELALKPVPFYPADTFESQRLYEHSLLEFRYVRDGGDWLDISECMVNWPQPYGGNPPAPTRIWNLAAPLFHDLATAHNRLDGEFAYLHKLGNLEVCERLRMGDDTVPDDQKLGVLDGDPDSGWRSVVHALRLSYVSRTTLEASIAALALAEFRRAHGEYPDTLDDLVPTFLPHVPIDYGDCKALRYRRLENDDYLFYSIGVNGKDDGGQTGHHFEKRPCDFYPENPDAVFSRIRRQETHN